MDTVLVRQYNMIPGCAPGLRRRWVLSCPRAPACWCPGPGRGRASPPPPAGPTWPPSSAPRCRPAQSPGWWGCPWCSHPLPCTQQDEGWRCKLYFLTCWAAPPPWWCCPWRRPPGSAWGRPGRGSGGTAAGCWSWRDPAAGYLQQGDEMI